MTVRSREELLSLADGALQHAGDAAAEVTLHDVAASLTRFAGNRIHQNVAESGQHWRARVIVGPRVAVAVHSGGSSDMGERLIREARRTLGVLPDTEVAPLPQASDDGDLPVAFSEATAAADPELRAAMVDTIVTNAKQRGLQAYGFVSAQTSATAVCNTNGLQRQATSTQAGAIALMRGDNGSGYASRHSADIAAIDCEALAAEAIETCMRNQNPEPVEPGDYEVLLSPYAVTELLFHLGWVGFSALAVQEHRSFMRLGERIMSESVTIRDDPRTDELFPYPFDGEGVTAQPVTLIERGVCNAVVYDTPTALQDGVASTGHSLAQPNTWGPLTMHLTMDAGEQSLEEILGQVRRGLYVNRLWYVRDVHPLRTIITGMTREGTFLIENGRLGRAVKDLRFTQSIVDALADVRGVSRARMLELGEEESGVLAPWLHLGHFSFTS